MAELENEDQASEAPSSVTADGIENGSDREQSVETQIDSEHDVEEDSEEITGYEEDGNDNDTERTIENDEREEDGKDQEDVREVVTPQPQPQPSSSRYDTRTKGGRSATTFQKYDQKFHPMDVYTRPTRAARRFDIAEHFTASTARDEPASDKEDIVPIDSPSTNGERTDNGLRKSSRSATKKPPNYSTKYHPQDYGIPGFQHRAFQAVSFKSVPAQASPMPGRKRKRAVVQNAESVEDDELIEVQPSKPRKKFRQLDDKRLSKAKGGKKTKKSVMSSDADELVNETLLKIGVDPPQPTSTAKPSPFKTHRSEPWNEVESIVEDALNKSTPGSRLQQKAAKRRGTSPSKAIPISSDGPPNSDLDLDLDQARLQNHDFGERTNIINAHGAGNPARSSRTLAAESESHIYATENEHEQEPPSEFDEEFAITQIPMPSSSGVNAFSQLLWGAATAREASNGKSTPSETRQSLIPPDPVQSYDDPPTSGPVESSMNTKFSFETDDDGEQHDYDEDDEDGHVVGFDDIPIEQPGLVEIHLPHPKSEMESMQDYDEIGPHELWSQMGSGGSHRINAH